MVKLFVDLPWEIYRFVFFFVLFALYVTLLNGLPLSGWLTGTSDCLPFKKILSLSARTQLILCLRILQFFQIQ